MVLVGVEEKFGFDATHTGCVESAHALCCIDAVVLLAVDAEDGGIPFVDEAVWRVVVGALGVGRLVAVPKGVVVLPVGEPVLLGLGVHGFEVEGSVVRDEALEALVVVAGEVVDAEAAERGTYGTHAVAIDIGQRVASIVDGAEVVAHALACPVARDFLKPFLSEAGEAAAVGGDDDVALRCHDVEVPAIRPELRDGRLGTTFAEEQCGVLLRWVEVRWLYDPVEELQAVGGLAPTGLGGAWGKLREDVVVLGGEAGCNS